MGKFNCNSIITCVNL